MRRYSRHRLGRIFQRRFGELAFQPGIRIQSLNSPPDSVDDTSAEQAIARMRAKGL